MQFTVVVCASMILLGSCGIGFGEPDAAMPRQHDIVNKPEPWRFFNTKYFGQQSNDAEEFQEGDDSPSSRTGRSDPNWPLTPGFTSFMNTNLTKIFYFWKNMFYIIGDFTRQIFESIRKWYNA